MDGKKMTGGEVKNPSIFFTFVVCGIAIVSVLANVLSSLVHPYTMGVFAITGGFILFPITFVLSDIISDVYGYHRSRQVSWFVAAVNIFTSLAFIGMYLFLGAERGAGIVQLAKVSWHISLVGIISFQFGCYINDIIFQYIKKRMERFFWFRSLISSIAGEILDSGLFVFAGVYLAFGIPLKMAVTMWASQVVLKLLVETVLTPTQYLMRKVGRKYDPDAFVHPARYGLFGGGNR